MNNEQLYLYEVIEDYIYGDDEVKKEAYDYFCHCVWSSSNKRRTYTKSINYNVNKHKIDSDIGQVFNTWSSVEYKYYVSTTKDYNWASVIRQKINNLYTIYFDKNVITNKEYIDQLRVPQNLYYDWIKNGTEYTGNELTLIIDDAMAEAELLREKFANQKMDKNWNEFKKIIEEMLVDIFRTCSTIEDIEDDDVLVNYTDRLEDNFYIRYFCKSLDKMMLKFQKKYYEVRDHQQLKRCEICGAMFEIKNKKWDYSSKYCDKCKKEMERECNRIRKQRQRCK